MIKLKKKDSIVVSVVLATYNQEDFIKQALDSIVMQETNFKYEVLVGNDCSTDNTKDVLKDYEKYDYIRIFNHKKNKGATKNMYDMLKQTQGKYVAFLEGDDYWTDKYKLQKQVDFLDNNPGYVGVAHNQEIVNKDGEHITTFDNWSRTHSKKYTFKDMERGRIYFQGNSLLVRNHYINDDITFLYKLDPLIGDRTMYAYLTSYGDIYILPDVMGAYRWFEKPWRKDTLFNSTKHSLDYYTKLEQVDLPNNHRVNLRKYKNELIAQYYFASIVRREKLKKENNKIINSYTKDLLLFVLIKDFFRVLFSYIRKVFWNIIKIFKK